NCGRWRRSIPEAPPRRSSNRRSTISFRVEKKSFGDAMERQHIGEKDTMKQLTGLVLAVVMVVGMAGSRLYAHDETFKGTVIASEAPKLKANVANLKLNVIDDKTKKESVMEFVVTAKTKVLRGD